MSEAPPNEVSGLQIPSGRIDDAIAKVDGLVGDLMKNTGIPGMAVAIVRGGKAVYAKGFGVRDASKGDGQDNKVDADTVFQLASVSKSVGATVVAHEVTEGVVGWDTPVVSKLPWFALSDPYVTGHVTIADLYSHRSGSARPRRRQAGGSGLRPPPDARTSEVFAIGSRFESATPTPTSG